LPRTNALAYFATPSVRDGEKTFYENVTRRQQNFVDGVDHSSADFGVGVGHPGALKERFLKLFLRFKPVQHLRARSYYSGLAYKYKTKLKLGRAFQRLVC
jgi:hypothetical protein